VKKLLIIALLSFITTLNALAQEPFGNEWINYNQQYYAVKVTEKGLFRIGYNALLNAGVPLGTFDPRSFQVFARGQEQPIIVKNEHTGLFQPGDYIEFFAEGNTGWYDQGFYSDPSKQPNPNYSLVTDTATYYITWNNLLNNRRFTIETDVNFEGYTPASYFWHTERQDYTASYFLGETNNYGVTDPEYTEAQGWFDAAFNVGQSRSKTIPTANPYISGPQAQIEMAVAGASNYRLMDPDHHLRIQFAGQVIDTLYDGYKLLRFHRNLAVSALNPSGTTFVFSSINDLGTPVDRNAIVYIQVRYPHTFNLRNVSQLRMELPPSTGSKTLVQFTNFNVSPQDSIWLFDLENRRRIPVVQGETAFRALVPNPAQLRQCFLTSSAQVKTISQVRPVNSDPANFARFQNFLSPAHFNSDYLMITHESLLSAAEAFKSYRNSTGYKVLLVDVQQLYHQFAYGIQKHPMALRQFARYTIEHFDTPPGKLFLLGKAMNTRVARKHNQHWSNNLVPSFGDPASDILITAGLTEGTYVPAMATGRLAARNPQHVSLYLEKIMQYEAAQLQPEEWMKNVLHFGGGSSLGEQAILANYLKMYENTITDTLFGGYVRTFLKSSTEPIQINQSDSLKQIINNGVSLMTFFGHAAGIGFDISIDYPSEYNNYGKYPFLVANSCFAGDIFGESVSSSEEFVLIENKGTIGYLAATSAAGAFELNRYTNAFLRNLSGNQYGQPVGQNIQQVIREIESSNIYIKNICLLNTLHADPALVINSQEKPDYKITPQNIYFSPSDVTTELDSFMVNVISTNIGMAIRDSVMVELTRTFPDGSSENFLKRIPGTLFKDTLYFSMPVDRERGIGVNQFSVTLNAFNEVDEITLANNTASTNLLIKSADVLPVFPHQYAIVPEPQITLKASTGDAFLAARTYVFELDTSASFSNPIRHTVTQGGGVLTWEPPTSLTDSTVYFWRVSQDSVYTGEYNWRSSSFQYINGREGWSQAHFDQFGRNQYRYVHYNREDRQWDFVNNFLSIQAQTGVYPYIPWNEVWLKVNGVMMKIWSCMTDTGNGMVFNVFDPVSGEIWYSENQGDNTGPYGNFHCSANPLPGFDFYTTNETWRERVRAFIDTIPDGHYVMAWNHRNHFAQAYHEELYQAFESIGSANIRNLVNNTPYLIFGRKGDPIGSANEVLGGSVTSIIQLNDSLETNWNEGFILSERIGPARNWESIHWRQESFDGLNTDSVWLQVLGVRHNGQLDTILNNIPVVETDIFNLDEVIDANVYPYLHLKVNMRDDENRTPAQMKRWQVIYQGIPEAALDPNFHLYFVADTLPEGKELVFSTAIRNISPYPMDSLLVHYWILDQNRNQHPIPYPRQAPLLPGESLIDTIRVSTKGLPGHNSFWVEVNPNQDQVEQYHFNNIGKIPFFVERDKSNPLLDVTFDGIRILDGDIVSAQPLIRVMLQDENQFLALNDTSLVKIFLQTPLHPEPRRIYFQEGGVEQLRFFPASLPDNTCMVEYHPTFTEDGTYRLLVQATDRSMNESGQEDYSIRFEVVTQSTITEVLNWPNPFSTATHFVFTLTGTELPTYFKIQIMTITGKVVREIDLNELGPINIGRNITQYAWDGTDQFGDRLANGVYLYRVITSINDEKIELNPTQAARYFHREFGKMYLIR
jgi:hypothetical protein